MVTEQTQFSMAELHEFLKVEVAPDACTKRQLHMLAFSKTFTGRDFESAGGEGNVQRVRVLAEEKDGGTIITFKLVPKLPPSTLAAKQQQAKRQQAEGAKLEAVVVFKLLLASDPKKAAEFLKTEGYKVLDRSVVIAGLEMVQEAQKAAKKANKRKPAPKRVVPVQRVPKAKQDAYALALEQDRLNRIKASKDASANLRKKAS